MTLVEFDFTSATSKKNIQTLTTVDTNRLDTRFNDGKVDTAGRFWGGTMGPEIDNKVIINRGSLYKIDNRLLTTKIISPVSISNGIAWNIDDSKFYYIDSPTRKIISYNYYSLDGNITSPSVVFDFDEFNLTGVPDGMTIDTDDNLWVANHGGGCVLNIDPRERRILKIVQIPASRVTSLTFGGRLLDTLFVTTASLNTKQGNSMEPYAGRVFSVKGLGVRGLVPNKFKLNILNFKKDNN
ncbi:regucalcin [Nasonia vitripennis]|uniref:SMP-30/Gluconolactonase/LRE-like region domain-containing protein n=1 Tax=Nasonia vitripennis TaxID=7425 RepID=A0A7M7T896_NASVI|nr:regucalcin [Nasonia vitripennis]